MPWSIIVVSTVLGTVASHQPFVENPFCEIALPLAETSGAGCNFQRPEIIHSFELLASIPNFDSFAAFFSGREYAALVLGIVSGSCGARYPAFACVCTGHGFDPSSYTTAAKFGGFAYISFNSSPVSARRNTVNPAIFPAKCRFSWAGNCAGAITSSGLTLPASTFPPATFAPFA